jgi:hypothetical protein
MFLRIKDSVPMQFTFESKPFMLVHFNYDSPEVDGLTNNQDQSDDYIEFD